MDGLFETLNHFEGSPKPKEKKITPQQFESTILKRFHRLEKERLSRAERLRKEHYLQEEKRSDEDLPKNVVYEGPALLDRIDDIIFEKERKVELLKKKKRKEGLRKELSECTFKPKIYNKGCKKWLKKCEITPRTNKTAKLRRINSRRSQISVTTTNNKKSPKKKLKTARRRKSSMRKERGSKTSRASRIELDSQSYFQVSKKHEILLTKEEDIFTETKARFEDLEKEFEAAAATGDLIDGGTGPVEGRAAAEEEPKDLELDSGDELELKLERNLAAVSATFRKLNASREKLVQNHGQVAELGRDLDEIEQNLFAEFDEVADDQESPYFMKKRVNRLRQPGCQNTEIIFSNHTLQMKMKSRRTTSRKKAKKKRRRRKRASFAAAGTGSHAKITFGARKASYGGPRKTTNRRAKKAKKRSSKARKKELQIETLDLEEVMAYQRSKHQKVVQTSRRASSRYEKPQSSKQGGFMTSRTRITASKPEFFEEQKLNKTIKKAGKRTPYRQRGADQAEIKCINFAYMGESDEGRKGPKTKNFEVEALSAKTRNSRHRKRASVPFISIKRGHEVQFDQGGPQNNPDLFLKKSTELTHRDGYTRLDQRQGAEIDKQGTKKRSGSGQTAKKKPENSTFIQSLKNKFFMPSMSKEDLLDEGDFASKYHWSSAKPSNKSSTYLLSSQKSRKKMGKSAISQFQDSNYHNRSSRMQSRPVSRVDSLEREMPPRPQVERFEKVSGAERKQERMQKVIKLLQREARFEEDELLGQGGFQQSFEDEGTEGGLKLFGKGRKGSLKSFRNKQQLLKCLKELYADMEIEL